MRVKTKERHDAIVDAAAQLFLEVGYEGASMQELSKRIGGSKATLYNYFASKEELFVDVVCSFATKYLTEAGDEILLNEDETLSLKEVLTKFGEKMLQVLTNETRALAVYRMVIAESGRSDIGKLFHQSGPKQSLIKLKVIIEAAMNKGQLIKDDPQVKALQFLALITAEVNNRHFYRDLPPVTSTQIKEMVERAVTMFLAGASKH